MVGLILISVLSSNLHPDRFVDSLLMECFKPVAIEPGDPPLRKLQKERFNCQSAAVQRIWSFVLLGVWYDGPSRERQLLNVLPELAASRAALEPELAARVKWHELGLCLLRDLERVIAFKVRIGTEPPQLGHLARTARIDAEIDLLKLKESLKGVKP